MDELPRAELERPSPPGTPIERARAWLEWFGLGRLVLIAVSVALIGAGGYWLVAPPPPAVEASLPMSPGAVTTTVVAAPSESPGGGATPSSIAVPGAAAALPSTTSVPADIVVHVAGAVVAPGVHRLPAGARVADAVAAAGGPSTDAHTDAINLAAPLADGDRVYVPTVADEVDVPAGVTNARPPSGSVDGAVPAGPVPINAATAEQLDALPGVGPATAAAIVAHREQHGPFSSIDGLADVRGIGPAKLEAIRPMVTL